MIRHVSFLGTGIYKPRRRVSAEELDARMGVAPGTTMQTSGVAFRHFVGEGESAGFMGAAAAEAALADAGLKITDIDAIISVGNTRDQPLPGMGPNYKRLLASDEHPIPAWDINAVCLGFVAGLDAISFMIEGGRFERVLLIASEVASIGVNWGHLESACLFGDGAVAVVVGRSKAEDGSGIVATRFETYASGYHLCEAKGGGILNPPWNYTKETDTDFRFFMDGRKLFKHASAVLPGFFERTLKIAETTVEQLKLVVPHQASQAALKLMPRRLGVPEEKFFVNVQSHGNLVAASIPTAVHDAVKGGRLQRGDRFMMIGTSAGMSLAAMIVDY